MTKNISKLLQREPDGYIHTAIGEIALFGLMIGNQLELYKELGEPIAQCEPTDFVRKLARYVCFTKSSLRDEKYKPEKPVLSPQDIALLTEVDIEAIARLYVESHPSMFRKKDFSSRIGDSGEKSISFEEGEIEIPKQEGEKFSAYLLRLFVQQDERIKQELKGVVSSMSSALAGFSNSLSSSIKNTLSLGDSLKKTMEHIRPLHGASLQGGEIRAPLIDITEVSRRRAEEARVMPFRELATRLDGLIDATAEGTEFLIEANKIQTQIAGEIKTSGDQATRLARRNILLSVVVVVLSIVSIGIPFYIDSKSTHSNDVQRKDIQDDVSLLAGKLSEINRNILAASDGLKAENERLKEKSVSQERAMKSLSQQIERQATRLHELEKNLETSNLGR